MKKRNRLGTVFLVVSLFGFLFFSLQPWWPLDRVWVWTNLSVERLVLAFFEASMVGALADWFAVTALFRHPLGIPIPHTNILVRRKDDLAEALPRFLSGFLQKDNLTPLLLQFPYSEKIQGVLTKTGIADWVSDFLKHRLDDLIVAGDPPGVQALVSQFLEYSAEHLDSAAHWTSFLEWVKKQKIESLLLETSIDFLRSELVKNRSKLVEPLTALIKKNAGWQGLFVGQNTVEKMFDGVLEEMIEIRRDPHHQLRAFLRTSFDSYLAALRHDNSAPRKQIQTLVRQTFLDRTFQARASEAVVELLYRLRSDLDRDPPEGIVRTLANLEKTFLEKLESQADFRTSLDESIGKMLVVILEKTHAVENLTAGLTNVLKQTEAVHFVAKIEEAVWNDLQYIRVNGAVVGGIVGLVLAVVHSAFPRT